MSEDFEMDRIRDDQRRLFDGIAALRETQAAQTVINSQLSKDVDSLTKAVTTLTSTLDKSKGALWVLSIGSGVLGSLVTIAASALFGKKL